MSSRQLGVWLFSAWLSLSLLGCRKRQAAPVEDSFASISCSSVAEYFPFAVRGTGEFFNGVDQADWETRNLQHMREPSLYTCGQAFDTQPQYRFLWDRSLSEPIAVRLQAHPDGTGTLFIRELANGGMIPPPKPGEVAPTLDEWLALKTDKRIDLSADQTRHITQLFHTVFHHPFDPNPIGSSMDGSDWIFESRVEGLYRLRDFRNVPPQSARALGLLLVRDLGGIPLQPDAIY